jgi:hypothetical protein
MPNNGYFLHKKSLLDRFKDDYSSHTGYIQSARAEHTWNNPLTRRKRTKELNGWIKSFAGKRHIRKLSRFNAVNAGRDESLQVVHPEVEFDCLRYANILELPNGVCVDVYPTIRCPRRCAFVFRVMGFGEVDKDLHKNAGNLKYAIHGYYPVYGLERQPSEEFDIFCDDISELQKWSNNNGWGMGVGPSASSMELAREVAKSSETLSESTDEKLGYEKGHKNSRGEDAPWVIRSHKDNRILASFAKKKDAEEHMQRMKQYSKTESKANEEAEIKDKQYYLDMFDKAYKECVQLDIDDGGDGQNWANYFATGDEDPTTFSQKEADEIVGYYMEFHPNWEGENDRPYKDWMENIDNTPKTALDKEITRILKALYAPNESKQSEASDLEGYTSDVISELDTVWGCGEDGATRIAKKYADVIQQNYVDGDLLASETAKFIAGQEHLDESRKKTESKKSEIHLKFVETIIVPKWLWEAHVFGNEYGEDLDEHEQEILAQFEEDYGRKYTLDDKDAEADFHSRNDFDSYGGPCYEIDVYEES